MPLDIQLLASVRKPLLIRGLAIL